MFVAAAVPPSQNIHNTNRAATSNQAREKMPSSVIRFCMSAILRVVSEAPCAAGEHVYSQARGQQQADYGGKEQLGDAGI